jgi:ribose transport system ATP-binding protein
MTETSPIMRLQGVRKEFPNGTVALRGVDLDIIPGRVHGLLGANGAGKSTLIKVLSGNYAASAGTIIWKGEHVAWTSPREAMTCGLATIHQHIPLIPTLSVLENVYLGHPGFFFRRAGLRARFRAVCDRVKYWVDPDEMVEDLSIGARQMIAILQAVDSGAELIVMDEPTASLATSERELVYQIVRHLSAVENKAILFVSHFIDEIVALTDEVTVLRDGQAVMRAETRNLDEAKIATAIVGRELAEMEHSRAHRSLAALEAMPVLLEVRDLSSPGKIAPMSLNIRAGEVVGIAGLLGSGRSELLHCIFGADREAKGEVFLDGKKLNRNTRSAVRAGMGLVPEDRNRQGLIPAFEIWRNTTLPALEGISFARLIPNVAREKERGAEAIRRLSIKAQSPESLVTELSGGNAQKVTIAKWLFSDVRVFLLDEPTAGIDIGAKTDILILTRKIASEGNAVIFVSSEFEELMAVSDRILVMRDGKCVAEKAVENTSEHELVLLSGGKLPSISDASATETT